MRYDLALVDLDGTLTDSAPGIIASIEHAYDALDIPRPSEEALALFVGPPIEESVVRNGVPPERVPELVTAYRSAFTRGGMFDNSVYPGIVDALTALRAAGLRLCVATSKPEIFARQIVEHFELDGFFEAVCGASMDGTRSTKADVVAHALETMAATERGLPDLERIVMVGDREHDVLGARQHGIETVSVAWGYAPAGEIDEAAPLAVVQTPEELVGLLLG